MESTESIAVSTFTETFLGEDVHFYVLKLKESCFIWIGGASASFKTLVAAVTTRMTTEPICTQLLGDMTNTAGSNLAKRLVKKTKCQCFLSLNVSDASLHPLIEQYLVKCIEAERSKFFL